MFVTIEKGSTWLYDNGSYKSEVKIIKVIGDKVTFKDSLEMWRQSCNLEHFISNSSFLKERKRHNNQHKNLPKYFEV